MRNWTHRRPAWPRINRQAPLAKGLVFAGLGGGASTLHYSDASGYGNDGTLTNMDPATDWVWMPELGRWALDMDSYSYEYVNISNAAWVMPAPFSFACWCKPSLTPRTLSLWGNGNSVDGFSMRLVSGAIQAIDNGAVITAASYAWAQNELFHVAYTRSANAVGASAIYVNGISLGLTTDGGGCLGITTSDKQIGSRGGGAAAYFSGKISDVLLFSRALSPAEIQQLADPSNVMLSGLILPPKRRVFASVAAPPAGLSIPIAMHHYQHHLGV